MIPQTEREKLARLGFYLCRDGWIPEAEEIFTGLVDSEPAKDGPAIGLALCLIIKGDCDEAVKMLDRRLAQPECALKTPLSLYKLVALGMGGRLAEAKDFRAEMSNAGMNDALATADDLLAELARIGKQ